jgi:hypothetical protein
MMEPWDMLADNVMALNTMIERAEERAQMQRRRAQAEGDALRRQGAAEAQSLIARAEGRALDAGLDRAALRALLTKVEREARELVAQARAAGDAAELRMRVAAFEELSHVHAAVELRLMELQSRVWRELEPEIVG